MTVRRVATVVVQQATKVGLWSWIAVRLGATVGVNRRRRLLAWLGTLAPDDPAFLADLDGSWSGRAKPTEIARRSKLDAQEFYEQFARSGVPVIVSGAVDHWGIMQCTIEDLRRRYGDLSFQVRKGRDYDSMTYASMTLANYLDGLARGGVWNALGSSSGLYVG